MEPINLVQGEDRVISLPIKDADGVAVDLSTATQIIVAIIVANRIQAKYALNFIPDYGSCSVEGTANNEVAVLVRRGSSKLFPVGLLRATVLTEIPDADLTTRRNEYKFSLGNVVSGDLLSEALDLYTPVAPTNPVTNDSADTFDWTYVAGHTDPEEYEVSVDSGVNWNSVTVKPYSVGNVALLAGTVQVRVRANAALDQAAGAVLVNIVPFTAA